MSRPRQSSFGQRLLALVPTSVSPAAERRLPAPVRRLVGRVRSAVQDAFDLPSRTELREAMSRLEAVSRRLDELGPDAASGPVLGGASRGADSIEDERRKLKKLRKELKRELKTARSSKKKRKKTKTTINVGSPKAMKDRARSKSKKG